MVETKIKTHPTELKLAAFLSGSLPKRDCETIEEHIAGCDECRIRTVSAYESVKLFKNNQKGMVKKMKKINVYLVLATLAFTLSFIMPSYFIQLLVATLLFGIKWIVDSKSTKMLVMIYEAWKNGGEKEASRILETLDQPTKRF